MKRKKKLRPLGKILLDIEPYLLEMAAHDLQHGDFYGLLRAYLEIHLPDLKEEYIDNSSPVWYYGHKDNLKKLLKSK